MKSMIKRVYTEWLPTASYEKVEGYELEMYYENSESGKFYCEAWIKVELKK